MKMKSPSPNIIKRAPQRTCLACRQVKAKRELMRLVRVADGSVEVDVKGQKTGRGAYLCPTPACWESGLKGNRLEYCLRTSLSRENRQRLIEFGKSLGGIA